MKPGVARRVAAKVWVRGGLCLLLAVSAGPPAAAGTLRDEREVHLAGVRQLTFGGENAEAYWSADGGRLVFQSTRPPHACDQIFTLAPLATGGEPALLSSGRGAATCAFYQAGPAAGRILYSSTDGAAASCPPPPDRSAGYVWAVHPEFEIYSVLADGSDRRRLTDNSAYDAEATVCGRDGAIVFTSDRDGDLELYRMDADGGNVERLTHAPGYDGGAFFSPDCREIVWRAARSSSPEEAAADRELLARHLVRPGRLELYLARADGSEARRLTYLGAASFAPSFFPSGRRVIFSSNHGDPRGREFDLWAIDVDGGGLERVTYTAGFDGFPMFSPDGRRLAFASNRNQGRSGETDIYVAEWTGAPAAGDTAADRARADVAWLADDERGGRGVGGEGLARAADYIEERLKALGLEPAGEGGFRQEFEVPVEVTVAPATRLALDGAALGGEDFRPAGFSASGAAAGEVVAAGYGITAPDLGRDDYAGVAAAGRIVVVRRFVPGGDAFAAEDAQRRYGDLRYKAWNAREHGARALLVVDLPEVGEGEELPEEAPLPSLRVESQGDAGLPVLVLRRAAGEKLFAGAHGADLGVALALRTVRAENVVGRLRAGSPHPLPGAVLVGAHYDHLGLGGPASLAPGVSEPHNGADDNASGTAAVLEVARALAARRAELRRDVFLVAFSGEESGVLGSTAFTRRPPGGLALADLAAMLNLDMVGRLREDRLSVIGSDSAAEWAELVPPVCRELGLECALGGDGYGPSDQTPFYAAGVPVLHFFTGAHDDYHKPSDDAERINAAGVARTAELVSRLALLLSARQAPLTYRAMPAPPPQGDVRSYGASLGVIPDYTGSPDGRPGVLLAGVRPGGPADQAGLRRGDLLVELGGSPMRDVYDLTYALRAAKPGARTTAVVERDGQRLTLEVVYGTSTRRR